ncbi:MAG: hypothetical protein EB078_04275 [Proteobacteria bacterium]|nr:hypothetical protein [Pseudomonadota bacterium]NDC24040.1 hypothetical protein [Pseudomonadota bacterium]NDD04100.1 hypothetical protein [Pseudomonadota bacterium]NDG27284.1 hypothetical protein [Pseudomonadota bacterium]
MTIFKDWFIFLGSAITILCNIALPFTYELDKPTIKIGETTTLTVRLPLAKDGSVPQLFEDLVVDHPDLKLLERNYHVDSNTHIWTYEFTAYQPGTFTIPPLQIKSSSDTFSTVAKTVSVISTRSENDMEIRAEFPRLVSPLPWRKLLTGLYWVLGLLATAWIIQWSFKQIQWARLRQLSLSFTLPNLTSDRQWLRKEIQRFRKQLLEGRNQAELIDEITYTLKVFFERKTHQPSPSLTTQELKKRINPRYHTSEIHASLLKTDAVKFQHTPHSALAEELLNTIERELL